VPIHYAIRPSGTIETTCAGDVTFDEVMRHFEELADSDLPPHLDVLLDLTGMTSVPETSQIRVVADRIERMLPKTRWARCAVAVKSDLFYGISRMFAVYAEQAFEEVQVFRDRSEAERWLVRVSGSGSRG